MNAQNDTTSEIGDAIRELAHVVRTEDEIEGIALQVDDLWQRVQAHQTVIDERDMLKRGGAELGRQIERYLTWVLDATGMHHLIDEDGDGDWELVWERLAEMGRARTAQDAQIAAPVPAGQPHATSGGSGASGGLGERLRALVLGSDPDEGAYESVDVGALLGMADEADRLEHDREGLRLRAELSEWTLAKRREKDEVASGGSCARCGAGITLPADDPENREMAVCAPCEIAVLKEGWQEARGQVEAIRAAITREAAHGDAITRCNLVAERFQTVLDSVAVETKNDTEEAP